MADLDAAESRADSAEAGSFAGDQDADTEAAVFSDPEMSERLAWLEERTTRPASCMWCRSIAEALIANGLWWLAFETRGGEQLLRLLLWAVISLHKLLGFVWL